MPGQHAQDLFAQAIDLFSSRVTEYADGIAQRLGQPMSGQQLSQQQVLDRWNYTPLGDTTQADLQYHNLVAGGMPPGQALDQVYPFRKMLFAGPDLKSQIDQASKIAGWDASAKGQPAPEPPDPSRLPMGHWANNVLGANQTPAPTSAVVGPSPVPGAGAIMGGAASPPPVLSPPMPPTGEMPPVAPGAMQPLEPVPGVS